MISNIAMCLATKRMIACSCRTVQKTVQPTSSTKKFFKLFAQMKNCFAADQKRIIKEMSGLMKDMNEEEFTTVFSKELFDGTDRMMKNKILPFENATLLLKHIGYRKTLNKLWSNSFERSSLSKTLKEMIVAEEKKKEEKNEDLLANMCECYLYLLITYPPKLLPVCVPCLLKAAMRKEESEVVRRDVEAALLALSIIGNRINQEKDQCFDQISDIIRYHQRHSNLTPLGYQSAWEFLIDRFRKARELGNEIVKELKFIREAAREIEELMGFVDWKKENDVMETEEERIIERWMETVRTFIFHCKSVEHECLHLVLCFSRLFVMARGLHLTVARKCLYIFCEMISQQPAFIILDNILRGGVFDLSSEELRRQTLDDQNTAYCLRFFLELSERLKEKEDEQSKEAGLMRLKIEILGKMEESGHEDVITSFYGAFFRLDNIFYFGFCENLAHFFVNI